MSSPVALTRRGDALWARLDRPEQGNACGSAVMAALEDWLAQAHDPEVRVLVLTGSGSSFCAGADVREAATLVKEDPDALLAFLLRGRDLVRAMLAAPVPTVAAVNGVAYAGGLELVLACDIAVAARSARLGDRHLAAGFVPGWGSSVLLPEAVGTAAARRLLLTGEAWTAEHAERRGLVSQVVDDGDLERTVDALVGLLAAPDPATTARMLAVARSDDGTRAGRWDREAAVLAEHVTSPEAQRAAQLAAAHLPRQETP